MPSLRELAERVAQLFKAKSRAQFLATLFVKVVLIVGAAAIAAVVQAIETAQSGKGVSALTATGIAAAVVVAIGGIFVTFSEKDSSEELETAREAVSRARDYNDEIERFQVVQDDVRRVTELYVAMTAMRRVILQAFPQIDIIRVIEQCLGIARRSLLIAFGFRIEQHWTIGIYIAERDSKGDYWLRLVAQERSIPCPTVDARRWPAGVGAAGAAYAKRAEIIIPDLLDSALGSAFTLGSYAKAEDDQRYRSIVAVPIRANDPERPWGVAIATSDNPGQFDIAAAPGLQTAEALRALAGMVELVIKLGSGTPERGGSATNLKP